MTDFFDRKDPWGNGMAVWVVMIMVFAIPLATWSLRQTRLENDVEKWLPKDDPELKILQWANDKFSFEERVFVTWDGSALNDPRIDLFINKLRGHLDHEGIRREGVPHIARALEPRELLLIMQQNGVGPQEAARRLEGLVIGAGSLKLKLTEFAKSGLRESKQELIAAAKSQFGIDLKFSEPVPDFWTLVAIPTPPTEEGGAVGEPSTPAVMNAAGTLIDSDSVTHDLQVTWKGMRPGSDQTLKVVQWLKTNESVRDPGRRFVEDAFFALGSPVTIALALSEAGLSDKQEAVAQIRQAASAVGISADALHMAGSTISTTELNREVGKAVWDPAFPVQQFHRRSVIMTSAVISTVLAYLLLRSIRLATIVLIVSVYATMVSTSLVSATGGAMNMVLVVMPSLLMVLTLSGAIHVANYWKHAACQNERTAISTTFNHSWMPCFLASLTTAIGLVSLCTSSLIPVRDFGIYSAAGTLLSLGVILFGVPALLQLWPGKAPEQNELDHPGWRLLGYGLTRWPVAQSILVLSICVAFSYGLCRFRTETKVIRYFPENARIAQDYQFIESYLAGIMPVETVIRFDVQSQKDTTFLDRLEVVREIQERLRVTPEITGSLSLADFLPVTESLEQDAGFLARSKHFKRANLIQQKIRDGEVPSARSFYAAADVSCDLIEKGDHRLNEAGDELWRITSQVNIMSDNDFAAVLADVHHVAQEVLKLHAGSTHVITGTVPLFLRTQQAVLQSLISSFGMAFILILAVFVVTLRSFWAGLVAMIPNIVPITVVFGCLSWMGQKVDVGTMITASIAMGIAVDGTLHYLTWVRMGMRSGQSRQEAIINSLVHCGPAMWQTSLAVALGLLVLVPADLLLISRFGWLMTSMIGVALLGDIILMPQLLAGPLGSLFEPKRPTVALANYSDDNGSSMPGAGGEVADPDSVPAPHFTSRTTTPEPRRPA